MEKILVTPEDFGTYFRSKKDFKSYLQLTVSFLGSYNVKEISIYRSTKTATSSFFVKYFQETRRLVILILNRFRHY